MYKIKDVADDTKFKSTLVVQKLNRLIDLGIVNKNGNFYYCQDKLLKYWIKYVYQKRLKDVELAPDKQRKQFKEEFHRSISNGKGVRPSDLVKRMSDPSGSARSKEKFELLNLITKGKCTTSSFMPMEEVLI